MASMNVDRADMKLPESVDRVGTVAGLPKAIGYFAVFFLLGDVIRAPAK